MACWDPLVQAGVSVSQCFEGYLLMTSSGSDHGNFPPKERLARSEYSFDGDTVADGERVGGEGMLLVSSG